MPKQFLYNVNGSTHLNETLPPGLYHLPVAKISRVERIVQSLEQRFLEPGTRHHWVFEGEAGDVVSISMLAVSEGMDTYLELFAPNGVRVMVGVCVLVAVADGVRVTVGVGEGVRVGVTVGVREAVGVGLAVRVGVAVHNGWAGPVFFFTRCEAAKEVS